MFVAGVFAKRIPRGIFRPFNHQIPLDRSLVGKKTGGLGHKCNDFDNKCGPCVLSGCSPILMSDKFLACATPGRIERNTKNGIPDGNLDSTKEPTYEELFLRA